MRIALYQSMPSLSQLVCEFLCYSLFVAVIVDNLARAQNTAASSHEDDNRDIEEKVE